jgi:hypothetical protein
MDAADAYPIYFFKYNGQLCNLSNRKDDFLLISK